MATYIKMNDIEGDVTARGHENWIEINAIQFDVSRSISTEPGRISDREGTRPAVSEITITKKMDKSSPLLFSEACVGKAKPEVQIDICQTSDSLSPYAQMTLNNVIVSAYEMILDVSKGQRYPHEKIRLSYDKIELKYTPYGADNKPESPIPAGYDLRQATAI
ncbi:MAG: type VI secretion system tube protein Hcp [Gammaproteobacteria bacterium]|nr:type VI secretion system tube protein Hcp [Gammaproteobacteria bacterium]MCH9743397.1 type VI secretion system tube protein Hcp [Gammaproteobacteria bacterium]